jgi:hypothetical protein
MRAPSLTPLNVPRAQNSAVKTASCPAVFVFLLSLARADNEVCFRWCSGLGTDAGRRLANAADDGAGGDATHPSEVDPLSLTS